MKRIPALSGWLAVMVVTFVGLTAQPQPKTPASGAPQFQLEPMWPKPLPNHWILGSVVGLAVDAKDHVWVLQRPSTLLDNEREATANPPTAECCKPAPPILEFDQAGNFVQGWGGPGPGYDWPTPEARDVQGEHIVYVDPRGNVWMGGEGPAASQLLKFTRDGKFLLQIGRKGQRKGSNDPDNLGGPSGLAMDPKTNELYVADGSQNRRVVVFDADTGKFKRQWGAYGNKPDDGPLPKYDPNGPRGQQFSTVHCVRLSHDGLVYVCDRSNDRIQVFRQDGTFVKEVLIAPQTLRGTVMDLEFSTDPAQRFMYVADGRNSKVWILRRDTLELLGSFGTPGHHAGGFTLAHSLAVDSKGTLYVGENLEGKRVQKFVLKGPRLPGR